MLWQDDRYNILIIKGYTKVHKCRSVGHNPSLLDWKSNSDHYFTLTFDDDNIGNNDSK